MRKNKNRALALGLAVGMAVSLMAGCGTDVVSVNQTGENTESQNSTSSNAGEAQAAGDVQTAERQGITRLR